MFRLCWSMDGCSSHNWGKQRRIAAPEAYMGTLYNNIANHWLRKNYAQNWVECWIQCSKLKTTSKLVHWKPDILQNYARKCGRSIGHSGFTVILVGCQEETLWLVFTTDEKAFFEKENLRNEHFTSKLACLRDTVRCMSGYRRSFGWLLHLLTICRS
jgi:hypothetical protein